LAANGEVNGAEELKEGPQIIGDVFIHPTATVDPTAVLGKARCSVILKG
jgi:hypothetical protein